MEKLSMVEVAENLSVDVTFYADHESEVRYPRTNLKILSYGPKTEFLVEISNLSNLTAIALKQFPINTRVQI